MQLSIAALVLFVSGLLTAQEPSEQSNQADAETAIATFAGGCFWCMEPPYDKLEGVSSTTTGYTGGSVPDPSYEQVSAGITGHVEVVRITYDPEQVSYGELLDVFWRNVDPTDPGGQFCDRGDSYRSGIFPLDAEQERLAQASRQELKDDPQAPSPIVTEITRADRFWPAESHHQDYYQKNPLRYRFYKYRCGRTDRLEELWGPR
jgi:peptide-methionine (S)-S-oxide reductase